MRKPLTKAEETALLDAAQAARENSYSPYSKFKVGAAVLTEDGRIFTGTNIENASYGLTVCAERNAMFAAVGAGQRRMRALALITQKLPGMAFNSPCGACRQVMSEFMPPNTPILIAVLDNNKRTVYRKQLRELMPFPFDKFSAK
ncbi:cytidine deaminase [Candidatus Avelusimicrobium gallicola]|uniref:Cytidine deaminase n=1 Tax=Candidatus Avelusimicrobium gallicola TaxID=2562704 RepID=A0A1Y4DM99_9BACT|nr:cytidine deaminase [Elusimicrobium sp. An273]OUO56521.1 cytidine deaminase [Elusimicrobium sp. An273]